MKKKNLVFLVLFTAAVLFLSTANVWAQDTAPAFDQKPSVVLDLWSNGGKGKYKDNIIFRSATVGQNGTFNVYGYDEKKKDWTLIGTSSLKGFSDSDRVETPRELKLRDYRWFAVQSPAPLKFDAQGKPNDSNDVVITIVDKNPVMDKPQGDNAPAFDLSNSKVLDLWTKVKGKYKDNINLKNGIGGKNVAFNVWGYDQKNSQWSIIGPKNLSPDPPPPLIFTGWGWYNPATDDSIDSTWKDNIKDFRWIAVQSLNGLSFNVDIAASKSDLILTVLK